MEPSRRPGRGPPRPSGLRYSVNAADINLPRPQSEIPQQSLKGRVMDAGRRIKRSVQGQALSFRKKNGGSPISSGSPRRTISDSQATPALTSDPRPDLEQILSRAASLNSSIKLLRGATLVEAAAPSARVSFAMDNAPTLNATVSDVLPSEAEPPAKKIQGRTNWFERAKDGVKWSLAARLASGTTVPPDGDLVGVGSHFTEQDGDRKLAPSNPQSKAEKIDTTDPPQNTTQTANEKVQDMVTGNHAISGRTETSHNRHSNTIIRPDHLVNNDSKFKLPSRSYTGSTAQTSIHPSIFDGHRNSIISTTSSLELTFRPSFPLPGAPWMQACSSSSSVATSNSASHQDLDSEDNPVLSLPDGYASTPRIVDNLVNRQEDSVTDQGTTSGWVNQQRRSAQNYQERMQPEAPEDKEEHQNMTSGANVTLRVQNDMETKVKSSLSVIDEQCSDAGYSNPDVVLSEHQRADDGSGREHLCIPQSLSSQRTQCLSEVDTVEGLSSTCSEDVRPAYLTPATSATYQPGPDVSEISEISEDGSTSDFTDETDETTNTDDSFLEAFEATSLSPDLLPCIVALREQVAARVFEKVSQWVRSCQSGQPSEGADSNESTPSESNSVFRDFNNSSSQGGGGKKRGIDGCDPNRSDKENGDDQGKRRKTNPTSTKEGTRNPEKMLACPFLKRYPDRELSPSCSKGSWTKVRRIKEHIYKKHMIPIHCERCITVFSTEPELKEHRRQAVSCEIVNPTENMIGIDGKIKEKLKSRRGVQHRPEIELWTNMYKILFPGVEIPSPYYDPEVVENPSNAADIVAECNGLIRQTVPQIINRVTENVLKIPEAQASLRGQERALSEIIHKAVWDGIEDALPKLEQRLLSKIASRDILSEEGAGISKEPTKEVVGGRETTSDNGPAIQPPIQMPSISQNSQNDDLFFDNNQSSFPQQQNLDDVYGNYGEVPYLNGVYSELDLLEMDLEHKFE